MNSREYLTVRNRHQQLMLTYSGTIENPSLIVVQDGLVSHRSRNTPEDVQLSVQTRSHVITNMAHISQCRWLLFKYLYIYLFVAQIKSLNSFNPSLFIGICRFWVSTVGLTMWLGSLRKIVSFIQFFYGCHQIAINDDAVLTKMLC